MKTSYFSKQIGEIQINTDMEKVSINANQLEFRSLNQDDESILIANYSRLLGDPENVKVFCSGNPYSIDKVESLIKSNRHSKSGLIGIFSAHEKITGQFVGFIEIELIANEFEKTGQGHKNVVEIGYILDKEFWGKGLGTEMAIVAKKYIKYAISAGIFDKEADLPQEIIATVHPENTGSIKILQKTLKNFETEAFYRYENPRLLFFKSLKPALLPIENVLEATSSHC